MDIDLTGLPRLVVPNLPVMPSATVAAPPAPAPAHASVGTQTQYQGTTIRLLDQPRRGTAAGTTPPQTTDVATQTPTWRSAASTLALDDKLLAAYLLGRDLDGRRVEGDLLALLKSANGTSSETRALMRNGRGNVKPDVVATQRASSSLAAAARDAADEQELPDGVEAGLIAHVGAGTCGDFAQVTDYVHAKKLKPGESILRIEHDRVDHSWNILASGDLEVNVDTWSEGPPVEACDAVYMKRREQVTGVYFIDETSAAAARASFEQGLQEVGPSLDPRIQQLRAEFDAKEKPPFQLWNPEPVVDKSFAKRVRNQLETTVTPDGERLSKGAVRRIKRNLAQSPDSEERRQEMARISQAELRSSLCNEIRAVDAARKTGADLQTAAAHAPEIVDAAKHLRRPSPRR